MPADRPTIIDLVRAAFSHDGRDGSEEVDIVRRTWELDPAAEGLELVAIEEGRTVGHVLAAIGDLDGRPVVGVAPLAVVPDRHGDGIGSALMTDLIERAEAGGLPMLVLLGSPAYYGRFGFEAAGPLGIAYRPVGAGDPHFQVRRLATHNPSHRGDFTYCWEREGPVESDVR